MRRPAPPEEPGPEIRDEPSTEPAPALDEAFDALGGPRPANGDAAEGALRGGLDRSGQRAGRRPGFGGRDDRQHDPVVALAGGSGRHRGLAGLVRQSAPGAERDQVLVHGLAGPTLDPGLAQDPHRPERPAEVVLLLLRDLDGAGGH